VWKATSGTPSSVSYTSSIAGQPSGRADYVQGAPLYPSKKNIHQRLNPAAFAVVPNNTYRYGNSQCNMAFGPSFSEWDAGVLKDFKLGERVTFQFRAEAFDVLNLANFGNPGANLSTPASFGVVSGT
jgi:hypothetical protein